MQANPSAALFFRQCGSVKKLENLRLKAPPQGSSPQIEWLKGRDFLTFHTKALAHRPPGMPARLLFQDEARFGRLSDRRRCWAPWPQRPSVGQQVIREYVYGLVAVSPRDGQLSSLVLPWVDAEAMSVFLAQTAADFPDDYCVMLLDGAGWHRATALHVPSRLRLRPLPPYSPDLNPVEHVWKHLREHSLGNRLFPSLQAVLAALALA